MSNTYQPSLFSMVTIIGKNEEDREFLVNYSSHGTKVWLTKTLIWALTNDREVSIMRATPDEVATRPLFTPKEPAMS